jgi:hypothetical protein
MTSKFPGMASRRIFAIFLGFLLGILHVLLLLFSTTGAGHGPEDLAVFIGPIFFGAASVLWFVTPFQYALYADVAFRRDRNLGLRLAILHYASGSLLLAYSVIVGPLTRQSADIGLNRVILDVVVTYTIFIALNVLYFRRILSSPK